MTRRPRKPARTQCLACQRGGLTATESRRLCERCKASTNPDGLFKARRRSKCGWCPVAIEAGQQTTGRRGHGWVHVECAEAIDASKSKR